MTKFKPPTFDERAALAAKAKEAALEKLRTKRPVDEAIIAARQQARLAREAADAAKRQVRRAAWEQEKADREARAIERRELEEAIPVLTDAERKAARDARYSRRKRPGRTSTP